MDFAMTVFQPEIPGYMFMLYYILPGFHMEGFFVR
jgi:hypothetical protein